MADYPRRPLFSPEWGVAFEERVETYMMTLAEGLDLPADVEEPETFTGEPYDGCETCHFRELMYFATALAIEGYINGDVTLEEPEVSA
jgi:hypothetical protein